MSRLKLISKGWPDQHCENKSMPEGKGSIDTSFEAATIIQVKNNEGPELNNEQR